MTDIFAGLPRGHFGAVVADVPWYYKNWSVLGEERNALRHYDCMTHDEICAMPVASLCKPSAVLVLWIIDTHIDRALEVLGAWGFKYKTVAYHWAKTNRDGSFFTGMGYWTRANPEIALLATIGRPSRLNKNVKRLIVAPRRDHSRKPDQVYWRTRRLVAGPYLDLFARRRRRFWTSWGDELPRLSDPESDRWV